MKEVDVDIGLSPDPTQQKAIEKIVNSPHKINFLIGRAGYGKSFTIKHIVNELINNGVSKSKIHFCGPTGKSSKVLQSELAIMDLPNEAMTIHRMFGCRGVSWEFNEKVKFDADVCFVDESSMVDSLLMARIIYTLTPNCKIIFVGDPSQLFPVGPGAPFLDMVKNCPETMVNELGVCHRQREGSLIANASERCRNGESILWGSPGKHSIEGGLEDDLFLHSHNEGNQEILSEVRDIIKPWWEGGEDYVVLSPQHNGVVGIKEANNFLQEYLNHSANFLTIGYNKFGVGDRVRQTKNDYKLNDGKGIFNGFVGTVVDIEDGKKLIVDFDGDFVRYETNEQMMNLTLGYVVSFHAAQGSGYKKGVIIADRSHTFMLNRQLMYVGFSRFKEECHVVGQKKTVAMAIRKNVENVRNTFLSEELQEKFVVNDNT